MIYPGAVWNPGRNAGYKAGRNSMAFCSAHTTAGHNSTPIGLNGFFTWLVSRDGTIQQFAEADAIVWAACEWNVRGPAIEVEYLDEDVIFTPEARIATAGLIDWLTGLGIAKSYYDGDRLDVGSPVSGFVAHRALHENACDEHYDYWPQADWDAMTASSTGDDFLMGLTQDQQNGIYAGIQALVEGQWYPPADTTYHLPVVLTKLDEILKVLALTAPGGLTEEQIRQIVRDELDRTKIKPGTMRVRELGT